MCYSALGRLRSIFWFFIYFFFFIYLLLPFGDKCEEKEEVKNQKLGEPEAVSRSARSLIPLIKT